MGLLPLIGEAVSDLDTALPLAREVRWDYDKDEPVWRGGNPETVTGAEAVLAWAWNAVNTARCRHDVFTHNYGQDLQGLIGKAYSREVREAEAIRCIREALEESPYIKAVYQISAELEGAELVLSFRLRTVYGEIGLSGGRIAV